MINKNLILSLIIFFSLYMSSVGVEKDWGEVKCWVYQLCDYRDDKLAEIQSTDFDLAVIDLSRDGGSGYFTAEEIKSVKDSGKIVLAYFMVGAIEDYRPEWKGIPAELKMGKVGGWPREQYVKFWDERWWPVVQGRIDQAIKSGFDGAYLDLITAYEEIPNSGLTSEQRAHKMVDLIERISKYAKGKNPQFKIVPQNCPELYTWSYWEPKLNKKYIATIDGLGLESVFYMAHDKSANKDWCMENRQNAIAIQKAGKLVLGVDYAKQKKNRIDGYKKQRAIGFVPYVSVVELNKVVNE